MSRHGPGMACPHCGSPSTARTSAALNRLYREVIYVCRNTTCGHVFLCGLEAVRTLSPSAIPDPEVNLPLATSVRRRELSAQMTHAPEATTP